MIDEVQATIKTGTNNGTESGNCPKCKAAAPSQDGDVIGYTQVVNVHVVAVQYKCDKCSHEYVIAYKRTLPSMIYGVGHA